MSGVEVVQVIAAVSELVRLSFLFCQFLKRLREANKNADKSLKRIKQLREIAYGVEIALECRKEQAGRGSVPRGEQKVWKYLWTSIKRCHETVLDIRKVYTNPNIENDPTLVNRAINRAVSAIRLEVMQKNDLKEHYAALTIQLEAIQLNTQTLNA